MSFTDLSSWNPALRLLWITLLVALWVGATIANIATVFGQPVTFAALAGVSALAAVLLAPRLHRALPA